MTRIRTAAIAAAILCSLTSEAQQDWKVGGNALTAAGKFGSTNNFPVNFITNNVTRMSLTNAGNLKLNSDQSSIQFPNPGTAPKPMMFMYESGSINTSRMVLAYSAAFPNYGLRYNGFDKFDFTDGTSTALDIDLTNSRIGVGTGSPKSKLHVQLGNSGITPFFQSVITAENSSNAYINVLAPSANETGILFGKSDNNVSGGIIYNSGFTSPTLNGLQFRTNGNIPRMVLTSEGKLGIGQTLSPGLYRVRIDHGGATGGLDIASTVIGTDWELLATGSGLDLFADGTSNLRGFFDRTSGVYSALSDERVKKNIKPMADVLEKIKQLKPSSYQFKNADDQREHDGFIAQDVMKVFPELVTHNTDSARNLDRYLLDYSGFGVIAVKAIQELMQVIKEQDERIAALEKKQAGATVNTISNDEIQDKSNITSGAILEQNQPNPFSSITTIRYSIPQGAKGQLQIFNASGSLVKTFIANEKGQAVINAGELSAGAYTYTLFVNGKSAASKTMVLMK